MNEHVNLAIDKRMDGPRTLRQRQMPAASSRLKPPQPIDLRTIVILSSDCGGYTEQAIFSEHLQATLH